MKRALPALALALIGAAPGSFWWAHFADDMSKYPRGWAYVVPWGSLVVVLAGLPAFGLSWAVSWLAGRRPPPWGLALGVGLAFGLVGVPTAVAVAVWCGW